MEITNIKEYTKKWKEDIKNRANGKKVSLAIIQVGDVEASNRYVRNKLKDCEEVGIEGKLYKIDNTEITTYELCEIVKSCKEDGVIVQLPLPYQIDVTEVTNAIPFEKDVDGFKLGSKFTPCTPGGILRYLKDHFDLDGKNAVVLGRSNIVGKPMAKLLLQENCTVSVCHTHTLETDKRTLLKNADLVVCATGHRGSMSSKDAPKAFIVDVGINFNDGHMCGDVIVMYGDQDRVTPVPGGVGLLTRCQLLENTLQAANV